MHKDDKVILVKLSRFMRYTVHDLQSDFPDEAACLEWLVNYLYPDGITCKVCEKITKHHPMKTRKSYSCDECGHHVHPTAGTIFHKSRTPLRSWFHAVYLMSTNKAGTSAKQIERELGVTYKTAWRMMHQIRTMMEAPDGQLTGEVEVDETYVHANTYKRSSARRKYGYTGRRAGQIIFGAVQRGGMVKVHHVRAPGVRVLMPIIEKDIAKGSLIHSDGYGAYKTLEQRGYQHQTTNHTLLQYVDGDNYTQNIENVWSHFKRGIKGVYRHIDPKYLQAYANEYAWRYNYRNKPSMFWSLMGRISFEQPSSKS